MALRWKIMCNSTTTGRVGIWALGYPTRRAAVHDVKRFAGIDVASRERRFTIERMTAEDEALASQLERH